MVREASWAASAVGAVVNLKGANGAMAAAELKLADGKFKNLSGNIKNMAGKYRVTEKR